MAKDTLTCGQKAHESKTCDLQTHESKARELKTHELSHDEVHKLVACALAARQKAYTPYSHFSVGAALLCADGAVYTGCNIESASYTPANCAERTAFFKAVSEGKRAFLAIAIVGGASDAPISELCAPCGVCRQVMREFCDPATFKVILASSAEAWQVFTLEELLPLSFGPENLGKPAPHTCCDDHKG